MERTNRVIAIVGIVAIIAFATIVIGFTILDQERPGTTTVMETKVIETDLVNYETLNNDLWMQTTWGRLTPLSSSDKQLIELQLTANVYSTSPNHFRYMEIEWTAPDRAESAICSWDTSPFLDWRTDYRSGTDQWTLKAGMDRGNQFEDNSNKLFTGHMLWKEDVGSNDPFTVRCTLGISENGVINEYVQDFEYHLNRTG